MTRALLALAGAALLALATTTAGAQRSRPRFGVAVDPEPRTPVIPYPGANVTFDPQLRTTTATHTNRPRRVVQHPAPPVIVYVIPVPVYGGEGDYGYGYAAPRPGGVYDTNGRPMAQGIGFDAGPSASAAPSYTPDLSGSPYVVIEGGAMLVDLPSGERRSVASCAAEDPDGRPRTVFYQGGPASVVLRAGQRGRVQGTPAPNARACYSVDAWGRVALEY